MQDRYDVSEKIDWTRPNRVAPATLALWHKLYALVCDYKRRHGISTAFHKMPASVSDKADALARIASR